MRKDEFPIVHEYCRQEKAKTLKKVEEKIDFEEKWLIDIKMNNGFISIADIEVAMSGIRSFIAELKGENNGQT
jgi:hypothetical protein